MKKIKIYKTMKKDIIKFILLTLVIYNIIPIINKIVPESTNYNK